MKTHKVIDIVTPENGGAEGDFSGSFYECQEWVSQQGYGYEIIPLTESEYKFENNI